jgi:hypothetical protein
MTAAPAKVGTDGGSEVPGRAMRVAEVLVGKGSVEFVKPGKLVDLHFAKGQSLSLGSARLLALMILTAGGDAWQPMRHRMRKADIRRGHKSNERIPELLHELHGTHFAQDDLSWRGKKATHRFALLAASWDESVSDDGTADGGWIEWEFTESARALIRDSESYAVLNKQAVLGFRSAYALRLYELGALRIHRRAPIWKTDVIGMRSALGIPLEIYSDYAQLRRNVMERAKAEIDQLAHFTINWEEQRKGRKVVGLMFTFAPKDAVGQLLTVEELAKHSSGRAVRATGAIERVVGVAAPSPALLVPDGFPGGTIRYSALAEVVRRESGGWDVDYVADAYRKQMGSKLGRLRGEALTRSLTGFCKAWRERRGDA